mgnify:FL=1
MFKIKKFLAISTLVFFATSYVSSFSAIKESLTVKQEVKMLGVFSEPKVYPAGMIESFGKGCKEFFCRAQKATKKMSIVFNRGSEYHQRHPGAQLYALAQFELYYLQQLKKNEKKIQKFIAAWPDKKHGKTIVSLIKLNKSREKMRKALGMDLNTSTEEAMKRYWIMGDFLEKGEIKKKKINRDTKKREKLLAKYKKAVSIFNSALKDKEYENLYDEIQKK